MTLATSVKVKWKKPIRPQAIIVDMSTVSRGRIVPSSVWKLRYRVMMTTTMTSGMSRSRSESMKLLQLSETTGSP